MTSLDIGCGYPNPQEPYKKRGDIGLDVKRGYADVIGDAHYLPFRENSFESVCLHSTVDHLLNPFSALKEAYRVCAHTFTISVSNCDYWTHAFNKESPEHLFQWNICTMDNLLTSIGFKVIAVSFKFIGKRSTRLKYRFFRFICRFLFKGRNTKRFFYNVLEMKCQKCFYLIYPQDFGIDGNKGVAS